MDHAQGAGYNRYNYTGPHSHHSTSRWTHCCCCCCCCWHDEALRSPTRAAAAPAGGGGGPALLLLLLAAAQAGTHHHLQSPQALSQVGCQLPTSQAATASAVIDPCLVARAVLLLPLAAPAAVGLLTHHPQQQCRQQQQHWLPINAPAFRL